MNDDPQNHDPVNHPKHYTSHPSGVECIDVIEHFPTNAGNVIKYLWRMGLKPIANESLEDSRARLAATLQDAKKAQFYMNREVGRLTRMLAQLP